MPYALCLLPTALIYSNSLPPTWYYLLSSHKSFYAQPQPLTYHSTNDSLVYPLSSSHTTNYYHFIPLCPPGTQLRVFLLRTTFFTTSYHFLCMPLPTTTSCTLPALLAYFIPYVVSLSFWQCHLCHPANPVPMHEHNILWSTFFVYHMWYEVCPHYIGTTVALIGSRTKVESPGWWLFFHNWIWVLGIPKYQVVQLRRFQWHGSLCWTTRTGRRRPK